ncbi:outer membrane protein transport protein [Roseicyclus sp. F158]|uniref:Outer membrane protein transport protein n=1 Tax=Tropicimonas omnivorans TaxID=3075590 RepID=A0ABU3DK12_9RHOB|nr:outer membrane protein transport protein [Roseicyclus sp. F158]MDT0684006.1 outer membrane protein transport protein [Roseicyclus sp. F158]
MTRYLATASIIALASTAAHAGGLDRTGQPIGLLFSEGNYAELSFSRTNPDLNGEGLGTDATGLAPASPATGGFPLLQNAIDGGTEYDDVGESFNTVGAGIKWQFNSTISGALLFDEAFGADIAYSGDNSTTELGGTRAKADSSSLTALLRYAFDDNWSAHGGIRVQRASGDISLRGTSYGPVNGYNVELEDDTSVGYVIGGAYEIPAIALRVALTYSTEIEHDFDTTESYNTAPLTGVGTTLVGAPGTPPGAGAGVAAGAAAALSGSSTTEVKTPQSVNIDFQSGVAEDTLVFGSIRWAEWSEFQINPENFEDLTGGGLVDLDDTWTYTIGVGRRFTEQFAAQASFTYEPETGDDELVSPLAPTRGQKAIAIGGSYDLDGGVTLAGGVRYAWLGDATAETGTPDVARAEFRDSTALSVGMRIGFAF